MTNAEVRWTWVGKELRDHNNNTVLGVQFAELHIKPDTARLIAAAPSMHAELEADNIFFRGLLKHLSTAVDTGILQAIEHRLVSNEITLKKADGHD